MSALFDSLAVGFSGDAAQRAVLDAALRDGLPSPRAEAWRHTPLRQLERRSFAPVASTPAIDAALLADIPAPRLVFVNGRHAPSLSDIHGLPAGIELRPLSTTSDSAGTHASGVRLDRGEEVFARLNLALANEGVLLRAEAGSTTTAPLHLVFVGTSDGADNAWHLRNIVELAAGSSLSLVEHHVQAVAHAGLANMLTQVRLAAGARLVHARVNAGGDRATSLQRTDAVLAGDAEYRRVDLELGDALSRHELNVRMQGERARLFANGVLLASGRRHVDTRLGIDHAARDTACELTWRGLGAGRGRAVFHGGILIREGADGTDAMLSNKNLLLSEHAEIDTQPVLEIHADEVKAAHGATVGRLDANALFYLRSRGLPQHEAQRLLTAAFCREPLSIIEDGALRERLAARVDAALAELDA